MEKKRSGLLMLIGLVTVLSNAYALWNEYVRIFLKMPSLNNKLLNMVAAYTALYPSPLVVRPGHAHMNIAVWLIVVIACGLGLLLLNDICRLVLLTLCFANIVGFIATNYPYFGNAAYIAGNLVLPIVYIIYLNIPGVKKQFGGW